MYDADAGCPDGSRFVDQILARTRKAAIAGPRDARRTFVVTVRSRNETTFAGHLEIRSASDATTSRDVTGPTCEAVTTALALIAALAIDPDGPAKSGRPPDRRALRPLRDANPMPPCPPRRRKRRAAGAGGRVR